MELIGGFPEQTLFIDLDVVDGNGAPAPEAGVLLRL
jgi:hypothetical protein